MPCRYCRMSTTRSSGVTATTFTQGAYSFTQYSRITVPLGVSTRSTRTVYQGFFARYSRLSTFQTPGSSGWPSLGGRPSLNRISRLAPGTHAAVHRDDLGVAHLLQTIGGQRRAKTAPAIQNDRRVLVGKQRLDVALEHAAPDMPRAARAIDGELAVLTDVDEGEGLARLEPGPHLGDAAFRDALFRVADQGEKTRAMLHPL